MSLDKEIVLQFFCSTFYSSLDMVFCSSDREIFLKFEVEGREFAKFLRSLEQFIQTVKGQYNFW